MRQFWVRPRSARQSRSLCVALGAPVALLFNAWAFGLDQPNFDSIQRQTNNEVQLRLAAPATQNFLIEISQNLTDWSPLTAFKSTGTAQYTDSAAPFLGSRFYRA